MLNVELKLVTCSISAIDLDDAPLIDSPILNLSFERTFNYLLFSFHATTVPFLSPVLTISPTLNWFVLYFQMGLLDQMMKGHWKYLAV